MDDSDFPIVPGERTRLSAGSAPFVPRARPPAPSAWSSGPGAAAIAPTKGDDGARWGGGVWGGGGKGAPGDAPLPPWLSPGIGDSGGSGLDEINDGIPAEDLEAMERMMEEEQAEVEREIAAMDDSAMERPPSWGVGARTRGGEEGGGGEMSAVAAAVAAARAKVEKERADAAAMAAAAAGISSRPQDQDLSVKLCPFFSRPGGCRHGDRCWFRHASASTSQVAAAHAALDAAERARMMRREQRRREAAGDGDGEGREWGEWEEEEEEEEEMDGEEFEGIEEEALAAAERERSLGLVCGICHEGVVENKRRFGMLTSCSHVFCLDCIRRWRASAAEEAGGVGKEAARRCPECREESFFVVPSDAHVRDPYRKRLAIERFQRSRAQIPCAYYKQGDGVCPFGTSCFYMHRNKDGTYQDMSRPRIVLRASDGALGDLIRPTTLTDFFDAKFGTGPAASKEEPKPTPKPTPEDPIAAEKRRVREAALEEARKLARDRNAK